MDCHEMHHLAPPNAMKNMMGCFIYYGKWSFVIKSITSLASHYVDKKKP